MATIVNTTPQSGNESNSMSSIVMLVLGIGALLLIAFIFLPIVRRIVATPAAPSVTIPDKIDVNVNTGQ